MTSATGACGRRVIAKVDQLSLHISFLISAVFHYLGPAFAVLLFARIDVLGVAWLRIAAAAAVLAAWRRPWRLWRDLDRSTHLLLIGWGVVLAVMNSSFYLAIDRLPLGSVAAIEFVPVIVLAAFAARTTRNWLALLLAATGVYLLTGAHLVADPAGVAFATANAILFAFYIVLGHKVARCERIRGIDGLASAMLVAAVIALPIGIRDAAPRLHGPGGPGSRGRRRDLLLGDPVRLRQGRHGPTRPRHLCAVGVTATGHGNRDRRGRPHPAADSKRCARDRTGHRRCRHAPRRSRCCSAKCPTTHTKELTWNTRDSVRPA